MNSYKESLTDQDKEMIMFGIDFLVPYVHSLINLLSEVDISEEEFCKKLLKLYLNINSKDSGRIEASAIHNLFNINVLYTGTRSFVLTIKGIDKFDGFSFMETNKGMNIQDDLSNENLTISSNMTSLFLKQYKSPYLISETFKTFLVEGESIL